MYQPHMISPPIEHRCLRGSSSGAPISRGVPADHDAPLVGPRWQKHLGAERTVLRLVVGGFDRPGLRHDRVEALVYLLPTQRSSRGPSKRVNAGSVFSQILRVRAVTGRGLRHCAIQPADRRCCARPCRRQCRPGHEGGSAAMTARSPRGLRSCAGRSGGRPSPSSCKRCTIS